MASGSWSAGSDGSGTWSLNETTGVLTISGSGWTTVSSSSGSYPWYSYKNSIKSVVFNSGITAVGSYAFNNYTNLTSVSLPDTMVAIFDNAFAKTGITSITIPKNVNTIKVSAFYNCTSLKEIVVASDNSYFSDDDGVLLNKDQTTLMRCPSGKTNTQYTMPDTVTTIGEQAFYGCTKLTSVTISDGATSIGRQAFYNCTGLTSITIPDKVTTIYDNAFYNCTNLTSVTLSKSLTTMNYSVFYGCSSLSSITIPASVTSIGSSAFLYCTGITEIKFEGNSAPTLNSSSFQLGSSSTPVTATVYTKGGWGSDDVFTSSVKGNYTTFIYEKLAGAVTHVNVSGTWKESTPYVNVNGTWKEVVGVYVNVNGTWKEAV